MRGVRHEKLPEKVWQGVQLHRSVDGFTDSHPIVRDLRKRFRPEKRRFSGIVLDVVFDHFLIEHWERFSHDDFDRFVGNCYQELWAQRHLMPPRMEMVVTWMIERDWIRSYAHLAHVGRALDGLASRLKMNHDFHGSIEEVHRHHAAIEEGFLAFFPDLVDHVKQSSYSVK